MATVRRTITVTDEQDGGIKAQIEAGHYISDSHCIRDLIRRDQVCSAERDAIRSALVVGEASGEPGPFDPDGFKQRMSAERG